MTPSNTTQVADVKTKPRTFCWFVGQVMNDTGGKANPVAVNESSKNNLGVD